MTVDETKTKVEDPGELVADAVTEYLDKIKISRKPKTLAAYTTTLADFTESCTKQHLGEINRDDLLRFAAFLREAKKLSPRTVANKFANTVTFLKAAGVRGLLEKGDRPRFVEEDPECFEPEDKEILFTSCTPEELFLFMFFLWTGMREQEVIYFAWQDHSYKNREVHVRWKADYNWSPKGYKGRSIPIPTELNEMLEKRRQTAPKGCKLVFPTDGCKPTFDMLKKLKAVAIRAGIDPETVWLHKFRATFATWHLWSGVDIRTVQKWMGHKDIKSTMRYLKPNNRGQMVQGMVERTFAMTF